MPDTRFTVPMAEQPWPETEYIGLDNSNPPQWWGWSSDDETAEALQRFAPPYRPGDRFPVREEWIPVYNVNDVSDSGIFYPETCDCVMVPNEAWRGLERSMVNAGRMVKHTAELTREWIKQHAIAIEPAETLPDEFVRTWLTVVSCVPVKDGETWGWEVRT